MTVDIIGAPGEIAPERVAGRNAAVIDVFRATSVMVTAMENGARSIIPLTGVEECFELRRRMQAEGAGAGILLGGERDKVLIEGFDLDNSPYSYTREAVEGATIIMSTTNGTRAINRSEGAHGLYIASMLNATAVCREMAAAGKDIVLVCSGREDRFTMEDGLCAGFMAYILSNNDMGYALTDIAWVMSQIYSNNKEDLRRPLAAGLHYNDLMSSGFDRDVEYCLRRDVSRAAPRVAINGEIVL